MNKTLIKHLEPDDVKKFTGDFKSSQFMRKQIVRVLGDKADTRLNSMSSRDNMFETNNWAYLNAYDLGYIKAINEVINLLKSDDN